MKSILNNIVDELERLAVSLDALELALISKGTLRNGDIVATSAIPESIVRQRLSDLRMAIDSLPTEGTAEPGTDVPPEAVAVLQRRSQESPDRFLCSAHSRK